MTLITDGGSTKCDWVLLDPDGHIVLRTTTPGLNPTTLTDEQLTARLEANQNLREVFLEVRILDFYGAGCGTPTPRKRLCTILSSLFPNAQVTVAEDLAAAVHAVTTEPAVVCILGTGSNSCYYDGKDIHTPVVSLGYVLMDEAGGNYFGKELIRDYFYGKMPRQIANRFENKYDLDPDAIKLNLYSKPNPSAYLASFAEFIFDSNYTAPYFKSLLKKGITKFINRRVMTIDNVPDLPIHFIGSIAYFSSNIIKDILADKGLQAGKVIQRPIDGLIEYYRHR